MANHASHAALPYPIRGARYTILIPYLDADGDPTDPTTPDTEISKDDGSVADTTEEVTSPKNSIGMLTLTSEETDCSCLGIAAEAASGPKTTLATLYPRTLALITSGTSLDAGGASGGTFSSGSRPAYDVTGCFFVTTSGSGGGGANNQARKVTSYTPSTGAFNVSPNFETNISTDTNWVLLLPEGVTLGMLKTLRPLNDGYKLGVASNGDLTKVLTLADHVPQTGDSYAVVNSIAHGNAALKTDIEAILEDTGDTGVVLANAAITADKIANDAITANKIAADAIGSSELATSAAQKIADAGLVLKRGTITMVTQTTFTIAGGPQNEQAYRGCTVILTSPTAGEDGGATYSIRRITSTTYDTVFTITIDSAPDFTIATGHGYMILPPGFTHPDKSTLDTLAGRFTGITSLAQWLGLMAGIQTGNSTARTELRATGAGSGTFDETTDSLQAIRDRGDSAWTGGGGSLSDIVSVTPLIPPSIDVANTASYRIGLMLVNALDDLPTTSEITPGTISIDRKAAGGTSWTAVVTDAACSESAGLVYYDEVFDTATGYVLGDSLRFTFKSQKIVAGGNDFEITDSTGRIFYSRISLERSIYVDTQAIVTDLNAAITDEDLAEMIADAVAVQTDVAAGLANLDVAVSTRLAPTTAGRTLDVSSTGEAGIDLGNVGSPTATLNLSNTTIKAATDVDTKLGTPTGASIAEDLAKVSLGGDVAVQTTVDDGAASTTAFKAAAGLSSTDDFYKDASIVPTSGVLKGVARKVAGYVGATRTFTVDEAWPSAPANGVKMTIIGRLK